MSLSIMDSCLSEEPDRSSFEINTLPDSATPITNTWPQIAEEHCYPKVMAQWTSLDQALPTYHIFQSLKETTSNSQQNDDSGVESTDELSTTPNDLSSIEPEERAVMDRESESSEEDEVIDVEHIPVPPSLPYNERKVTSVMYECSNHMNLVRLPMEGNHDGLLEKAVIEGSYQQQLLVKKVMEVLHGEHIVRLSLVDTCYHPIKRRLSCDKAARKIRKILGDIKWDSKLCQWLHQLLLKALDNTYLPIYLDILQVLKSTCPTLVEGIIHGGSTGEGSNEAVNLLLKRPWCVTIGMTSIDKRVCFDPSPLFINIPHSISSLGGRRWKSFQNLLSSLGKVFPIVPPDYLYETGQECSPQEAIETFFHCAMTRIQEIKEQYPSRPIVLISWSTACRLACKIAEVEKERIVCLVNLGLPYRGIDHTWKISSDPFSLCKVPSIFITPNNGLTSSKHYIEELRLKMCQTLTSVVIVHGADDLLRLPVQLKEELSITQSALDRLLHDHIFQFLMYILPCKFASDIRLQRKRRVSNLMTDEHISSSQLSPANPNGAIVLTTHSSISEESWSPTVLKGLLNNGKVGLSGIGRSNSTSMKSLSQSVMSSLSSATDFPPNKLPKTSMPKIGRPPKTSNNRPRSKSTTLDSKLKGSKSTSRNRSASEEVSQTRQQQQLHVPTSPLTDNNTNYNNSNSTEASPNTLLAITQFQPSQIQALLPVTPPKNPYENPNQISEKIRKQLNL